MSLATSTKLRPTLERKFIALASVIILICSFIANTVIVNLYRNQQLAEAEERALLLAEATAISLTNTLLYESPDLMGKGGLIENYILDLVSYAAVAGVTVFDIDGKIITTDDEQQYRKTTQTDSVARWAALQAPLIESSGNSKTLTILYPLKSGGRRFGTLQFRFTTLSEMQRVSEFKRWMLLVTLAFAIFGILLAVLVARTLAKPVKKLASEMSQVKAPDYVANFSALRRDEIGDLEHSFIDMLSRLKEASEERERQQQALIQTEKLASVGTLVSGLAHEINNPLAGIRNCLRRIKTQPEDTSQTQKYAKLMDDALGRIEKIVRDLLDFSRKQELLLKPVNLNKIITAAFGLAQLELQKRSLTIALDLQKKYPIFSVKVSTCSRCFSTYFSMLSMQPPTVGEYR